MNLPVPFTPTRSIFLAVVFKAGFLICLGAFFPHHAEAQQRPAAVASNPSVNPAGPDALWRCELPGGVFLVAQHALCSVSSHEYIVDAAARVTEVTIGTTGSVEARFYYLEPLTTTATSAISSLPGSSAMDLLQEKAAQVQDRTGVQPVWEKVIKSYPTTTHAHTVEYRLSTKEDVQRLLRSLEDFWRSGRGTSIKID